MDRSKCELKQILNDATEFSTKFGKHRPPSIPQKRAASSKVVNYWSSPDSLHLFHGRSATTRRSYAVPGFLACAQCQYKSLDMCLYPAPNRRQPPAPTLSRTIFRNAPRTRSPADLRAEPWHRPSEIAPLTKFGRRFLARFLNRDANAVTNISELPTVER